MEQTAKKKERTVADFVKVDKKLLIFAGNNIKI